MTTLVCWCSRDSRGPAALYVASDSRFSWGTTVNWDVGPKIHLRGTTPEIFAFAGDVTLGQSVLLQIGISSPQPNTNEASTTDDGMREFLDAVSPGYPHGRAANDTVVLSARRIGEGMQANFAVSSFRYRSGNWELERHQLPVDNSDVVCAFGSGAKSAVSMVRDWMKEDVSGRTSRSIFSGFCDALRAGRDPLSGGPPQLAGIYRIEPAREFGVVWDGKFFVRGRSVETSNERTKFEWRNNLFERCDSETGARLENAQQHARPLAFRK